MQRLCGSDESRKVAHQRVGRLKKLGTVEPEVLYFQPGFFPDFPHHGVFFCLTAVHISSHQNIRGLAVLLDEQNFPGFLIHNNHADCHIVHREPVLLAFRAIRHNALFFQFFFNQCRAAFKAMLLNHFDTPNTVSVSRIPAAVFIVCSIKVRIACWSYPLSDALTI